jgi:hypothetical protein
LTRAQVRQLRRLREQQRARIRRLPRYRQRLKRLRVKQVTRMPPFQDRAAVGAGEDIYSLTYRFDSNAAAHPNPLALEQFLEPRPEGIAVLATPKGPRPDPYAVGAILLGAVVDLAGQRADQRELEPEFLAIRRRIAGLVSASVRER